MNLKPPSLEKMLDIGIRDAISCGNACAYAQGRSKWNEADYEQAIRRLCSNLRPFGEPFNTMADRFLAELEGRQPPPMPEPPEPQVDPLEQLLAELTA